ncbi:MAG: hypothetical protein ACXW3O_02525 [Brevundimonas sp.]
MKRTLAAAGLMAAMALAGCGQAPADDAALAEDAAAGATDAAAPAVAEARVTPPAPGGAAALPAAPGAPVFAVVYPGGSLSGPATVARGPDGAPGGILSFTTEATPEVVVAFYRQRAEAAGLSSVMAMNQGDARAYGAVGPARGAKLHVVATPVEDGPTNVQLDWTAGG